MSGVLYILFIHSTHNAKDRSLGVGRDIIVASLNRELEDARQYVHLRPQFIIVPSFQVCR